LKAVRFSIGDQAYSWRWRNWGGFAMPAEALQLDQVESFRVGGEDSDREDNLLDTFCYGIALGVGNSEGF
jgi:hypothetical protein